MKTQPVTYHAQLFINGEFTDAASGKTLDIINPATGGAIGLLADADANDVDRAVMAGQCAFEEGKWSGAPIQERARVLNRFADLFEADLEGFYQLETLNNGRPIVETRAQISRLPQFYCYFAALALTRRSDVIPVEGSYLCYTQRVPLGVVALMTSFSHPLMILSKSLALATGNSVVIKPSEQTPPTQRLPRNVETFPRHLEGSWLHPLSRIGILKEKGCTRDTPPEPGKFSSRRL